MINYIVRGIFIGGAMGVFGSLLGFTDNMPRAIALGMVGGFFAGLTMARRQDKKATAAKLAAKRAQAGADDENTPPIELPSKKSAKKKNGK